MPHLGYYYTKILAVYLKFNVNLASKILSGNPVCSASGITQSRGARAQGLTKDHTEFMYPGSMPLAPQDPLRLSESLYLKDRKVTKRCTETTSWRWRHPWMAKNRPPKMKCLELLTWVARVVPMALSTLKKYTDGIWSSNKGGMSMSESRLGKGTRPEVLTYWAYNYLQRRSG